MSKTFREKDLSITIKYGLGKVTGQLATDQVSFKNNTAEAINFISAKEVTGFEKMKIDGMLGLAPGSGSTFNKGFIKELYN